MGGELRGILFDFDGTIADTERAGHRVAYNRAFAELGLDWEWDEPLYGELLGVAGGKERLRHFVEHYGARVPPGAGLDALYAQIHAVKARHFAVLAPRIPLRPGVLRLATEARAAGIALALATTAAPEGVDALLAGHRELRAAISVIAAGDAVPNKKPAPDIYLLALERLGLAAQACVAIEDSRIGLEAALAARLPTLVTVSDYTSEEDFTGAYAVLSDLGEPGRPGRVLRGPGPAGGVVDVAFLRTAALATRNGS